MDIRNYEEFISGIREEVLEAEDLYLNQKKSVLQTRTSESDEKMQNKLQREVNHLSSLIQKNQEILKAKKEQIANLREEDEKLNVQVENVKYEVVNTEKELEKAKWRLQEEQNLDEVEKLEKELQHLQGKERELLKDSFRKVLEENPVEECGKKMNEEISQCSCDYVKKIQEFEDYLRDLENSKVKPRRQRLRNMGDCLVLLRAECEELQKTNDRLEEEIKSMQSGNDVCML